MFAAHDGHRLSDSGRKRRCSATSIAALASWAAALLCFSLIWIPEIRAYWIGLATIGVINVTAAKQTPDRSTLQEIGRQLLGVNWPVWSEDAPKEMVRQMAQSVLNGEVSFNGQTAKYKFPFESSSLDGGPVAHQLSMASMGTVRILHDAYRVTGERRFLEAAIVDALAYADVDRWRLVSRGLLWNDHALAVRIAVIAALWSDARETMDPDRARELLALAERTAARLAKRDLFTFRTNHGVMQNLALLQYAVAFPMLRNSSEYAALACSRLREQLHYYIHPEGPTLEHSAGYHEFGRTFLQRAIRLEELNGCQVPSDWPSKLKLARDFSRMLMRPDRTLPAIGNTDLAPLPADDDSLVLTSPPPHESAVYLGSGFAVSWSGLDHWPESSRLAQTVVTWSHFPSRAHKLSDDLSVVVWAAGQPWLTNTGYWPYGAIGQRDAVGWRGSNAPHQEGEPRFPRYPSALTGSGAAAGVRLLELRRRINDDVTVRRQVVEIGGHTWIVVDTSSAPSDAIVRRLWTLPPEIRFDRRAGSDFQIRAVENDMPARLTFLGTLHAMPRIAQGEFDPFAGWIIRNGNPLPAPAIEIKQRGNSTVATVLSVGSAANRDPRFGSPEASAERWAVELKTDADTLAIRRVGNELHIDEPGRSGRSVRINSVSADEEQRSSVIAAYEQAASRYAGMRDLLEYRYLLSEWMLLLLAVQLVVFAAARRWMARAVFPLQALTAVGWLAVGLTAYFWYLR